MARKSEGTPTETQPIRRQIENCKAHGAGAVEADQSGPKVDTANIAKPS
jgi:hypothetical protein